MLTKEECLIKAEQNEYQAKHVEPGPAGEIYLAAAKLWRRLADDIESAAFTGAGGQPCRPQGSPGTDLESPERRDRVA